MLLKFNIQGSRINEVNREYISEGKRDFINAEFTFSPDWDGLSKEAYFVKGAEKYKIPLIEDKIQRDAHLDLSKGYWSVCVYGLDSGTMVHSTGICSVVIDKTLPRDGTIPPETPPSEIDLILQKSQSAENKANTAVKTANTAMSTVDAKATEINGLITEYNTSKEDLLNAKSDAVLSASNAHTSETNAKTSEDNALQYKQDSETAKGLAEQAVIDSADNVRLAEGHEQNAKASEINAGVSELTAKEYATQAETAKTETEALLSTKADKSYVDSTFASAIKVTKNGTVISADDVSEIEHNVPAKVESANLIKKMEVGVNVTIDSDGDTVTQVAIDNIQYPYFRIYFYLQNKFVRAVNITRPQRPDSVFLGIVKTTFTKDSTFDEIRYGFGGQKIDTFAKVNVSHLKDGIYTLSFNVLNITQGYFEWNHNMLNKGDKALPYTPHISDLSQSKLNVMGKNLSKRNSVPSIGAGGVQYDNLTTNGEYTASVDASVFSDDSATQRRITISVHYLDGTKADKSTLFDKPKDGNFYRYSVTIKTSDKPIDYMFVYYRDFSQVGANPHCEVKNLQIAFNNSDPTYEPYQETEYTIQADGTVNNVQSVSPSMTMLCDTEGLSIEATYNADTKKYIDNKFNELQNAILSTGGNI